MMRRKQRKRALIGFGTGQVGLLIPMISLERRMKRTGGPGIIRFELAGTDERADQILAAWGPDGKAAARISLLLDYPYLVTYAGLQAALCEVAGETLRGRGHARLAEAGRTISLLQCTAGMFDAIENAALLGVLAGRRGRWPAVARCAAWVKFAMLTAGWAYMGAALGSRALGQIQGRGSLT
jgi:hypothetical protein